MVVLLCLSIQTMAQCSLCTSTAAGGRPGKGVECRDIVPGSDAFIDHWNPGVPLLEEQPGSILMMLFEEFSFYEIEILLMKRADYISQPFFIE